MLTKISKETKENRPEAVVFSGFGADGFSPPKAFVFFR